MSFQDFLMCPVEQGIGQIGATPTPPVVTPPYTVPVQHVTVKPARKRKPQNHHLTIYSLMKQYLEYKTKNS